MEAEKGFTDVELKRSQSTYEPIDCNCTYGDHLAVQRTRSRIQHDHNWSLKDGYCISGTDNDDDVENKKNDQGGAAITIANYLLVAWDENDPMNPRNLSYARKWVIVLIVSLGSVC